jgi:signal transduction histidine kinase
MSLCNHGALSCVLAKMHNQPPEGSIRSAEQAGSRAADSVPGGPPSFSRPCHGPGCTKVELERLRAEQHRLQIEIEEIGRQLEEKQHALRAEAAVGPGIHELAKAERQRADAQRLESLGVLAGGLAHQFNNLLTVIGGHVGLAALEAKPDSSLSLSLEEIRQATHRAADLCRRMLDAAGHSFAVRREIEPQALVEATFNLVGRADPGRCPLEYLPALITLPRVRGVAAQLQQALAALILNAFEAVGRGEGDVRVVVYDLPLEAREAAALSSPVKPARYVCFEVSDTGAGIPVALLPRIYEPFFSTKGAGRGLGLAVAAGVARAHGGGIGVVRHGERGTTFRLYIPALAAAPAAK